ncbi:MAG: GAF domain-containing protein [Firmicutes bacterium]|nr:GAF domain-containing protein [Bacillota bacterium]
MSADKPITELWSGNEAHSLYEQLLEQLEALMETNWLANLANTASLIYHTLPDLNWAGFYLRKNDELLLGPFQGKPACVLIPWGKGVCGTAAIKQKTIIVPDVHLFPGHIACDAASNAEIVIPIISDDRVWGVLDLDSPFKERFSTLDQRYLERLMELLHKHVNWRVVCEAL